MTTVLENFNFGRGFIYWVRKLCKDTTLCIKIMDIALIIFRHKGARLSPLCIAIYRICGGTLSTNKTGDTN